MFQSEIRLSDINDLIEKAADSKYGSYLKSISIIRARAFTDQKIRFDFPVTALIGPNGGGKSTVLGAVALAYKDAKPSHFMAKSGKYDESMQNWAFDYEIVEKSQKPKDVIRRRASFTKLKWYRDAMHRPIRIFGVARTVPATERKELKQCISGTYEASLPPVPLTPAVAKGVAAILDKDVSLFTSLKVDQRGKVTLLTGTTREGDKYSEFHFGAGESSIIRMLAELDGLDDNSLVLIEEIENGLHPVACVRLVEHLITLARDKSMQVVFTTHSNDALRPLPDKAIWAAVGGKLFQGKLDIASLRAVTGQVETILTVFVEDKFAETWVRIMLRSVPDVAMQAIGIHPMQGDGIAVNVHKHHNLNPALQHKSVCFLDGDSEQQTTIAGVYRLPGNALESFIFNQVMEKIDALGAELTVALLKPYEDHAKVVEILKSVANTNRDHHLIYSQIGKQLQFTPEERVREAFISIWTRNYADTVTSILAPLQSVIPKDTDTVSLRTS